jgi:hypothetical protein
MNRIVFLILVSLISSISLHAQFSINTELRPRGEIRNGYKSLFTKDDKTAYFVSQRTRLGLSYTHEEFALKITGQDIRVWGDESLYNATGAKGDEASVELYEAWFNINFWKYYSLRIGRQEWSYDDQRLLSTRNWAQSGLAYDGILVKYDNNHFRADIGLSLNNDAENRVGNEYTPDKMKFFDFVYLSQKLGQQSELTFTGIISGYQKEEGSETVYVSATYGPYFKTKTKKVEFESSLFHQTGTNITGQNINAYLISAKGFYAFTDKLKLGPGFDILSGNSSSGNSNTDHSFDVLYGGRHRFLGDMDYFTDLSKSVSDAGIVDLYAKSDIKFSKKNSLSLTYHHFMTHQSIPNPNLPSENLNKSLGDELDIMYKYKAEIPLEIRVGMVLFEPTKSMEILQGANGNVDNLQYFSYVQLTFTPEIFNSIH